MNKLKIWLLQKLTKCSEKQCTYTFYKENKSFSKARARLTLAYLSPKELQTIFDLMIAWGYYLGEKGSDYMCIALARACQKDMITYAEYKCTVDQIHQYILGDYALETYLLRNKLSASKTARMAIYKNWASRP